MTPSDLAAIHAQSFETPRPWHADEFSALLKEESVFLCTCEAGFALGRAAGGEAELLTLAEDPARRRHGSGTALLRAFEHAARQRSSETAFLEVSAVNKAALALYKSAGYAESGRRPNYYRDPDGRRIDAIVMAKSLASG
jgi:ribosomal-protein-alanine N-acetyltransferase